MTMRDYPMTMTRKRPWHTASLVGACISISAIFSSGNHFIYHSEYRSHQSHEATPVSPPQVRRPKTVEIPPCGEPPNRNAADYAHLFREKTVFMTMASSGQLDLYKAWIGMRDRSNEQQIVLAMDKQTATFACSIDMPYIYGDDYSVGQGEDMLFHSDSFMKLGLAKFRALKNILGEGHSVLFSELDINELSNPFCAGAKSESETDPRCIQEEGAFDLEIVADGNMNVAKPQLNIGFFFIRPSKSVMTFLDELIDCLYNGCGWDQRKFVDLIYQRGEPKPSCPVLQPGLLEADDFFFHYRKTQDHCIFNQNLNGVANPCANEADDKVRIRLLDTSHFVPNGGHSLPVCPTIVHCNTVATGQDQKMNCARGVIERFSHCFQPISGTHEFIIDFLRHRPYMVGSEEEQQCLALASRKDKTMKSLNKIRASLEVARNVVKNPMLSGDFVEAGVAEGGGSLAVLFYLACTGHLGDRKFHLFDSWKGVPSPGREEDSGFLGGSWHMPLDRFQANVERWGAYYRNSDLPPGKFHSWEDVEAAMQIHVGLFADTMPPALEFHSIAALYCDGIMYQSSWDCLASAGPRVQSGGWVYQDDFYAYSGNYQAVTDWIASSAKKHMRMQLVPEEGDFRTIKDLKGCKPPLNNDGRVSGTCENELTPVEACFWMVYYR